MDPLAKKWRSMSPPERAVWAAAYAGYFLAYDDLVRQKGIKVAYVDMATASVCAADRAVHALRCREEG